MNYTPTEDFQAHVEVFFKLHPEQKKYESPDNIRAIVTRMYSYGLSTPSDTMIFRALSELVAAGSVVRIDGGNEHTDRLAVAQAAQERIDKLASAPITNGDFENFSRMSEADVERLFYSDAVFQVRYKKASERWGFKIPPKPASSSDVPLDQDMSQWRTLDAKTYHSIPTSRIIQLYRSDAGFTRAVNRLIKNNQI